MRLIDADAIKYREESQCVGHGMNWTFIRVSKEEIDKMPTIDAVEVVHGRWDVIEASDELYKCSACGEWQYIPEEHFAYCPYCGAKMDGGDGDADC